MKFILFCWDSHRKTVYRADSSGIVLFHVSTERFITGVPPGPEGSFSLVGLRIARFLSQVIETEWHPLPWVEEPSLTQISMLSDHNLQEKDVPSSLGKTNHTQICSSPNAAVNTHSTMLMPALINHSSTQREQSLQLAWINNVSIVCSPFKTNTGTERTCTFPKLTEITASARLKNINLPTPHYRPIWQEWTDPCYTEQRHCETEKNNATWILLSKTHFQLHTDASRHNVTHRSVNNLLCCPFTEEVVIVEEKSHIFKKHNN